MLDNKSELTDEMLDNVVGGTGYYMIFTGDDGKYNIVAMQSSLEDVKKAAEGGFASFKASSMTQLLVGVRADKIEMVKNRLQKQGFELLNL